MYLVRSLLQHVKPWPTPRTYNVISSPCNLMRVGLAMTISVSGQAYDRLTIHMPAGQGPILIESIGLHNILTMFCVSPLL